MKIQGIVLWFVASALSVIANADLHAQVEIPPELVRQISIARKNSNASIFARVLSQTDQDFPSPTLDAVADTLVAVVQSGSSVSQELRRTAMHALILSGISTARRAYSGAGVRLFAIASTAPDAGDRGAALSGLTDLSNKAVAVKMLHDLALVHNSIAVGAIRELSTTFLKYGGEEALLDLFKGGQVNHEIAREGLEDVAQRLGWKR